jgi:hypothetical protein
MFLTFSLKKNFRPPPFEDFLKDKLSILYFFNFTRKKYYKGESQGFDTRNQPGLLISFLPLYILIHHFFYNNHE